MCEESQITFARVDNKNVKNLFIDVALFCLLSKNSEVH